MEPLARLFRLAAEGKPADFVALLEGLRDNVYDVRNVYPGITPTDDSRKIAGAILNEAIARLARVVKTQGGRRAGRVNDEGPYG